MNSLITAGRFRNSSSPVQDGSRISSSLIATNVCAEPMLKHLNDPNFVSSSHCETWCIVFGLFVEFGLALIATFA